MSRGPNPKNPDQRRRRNVASTNKTLVSTEQLELEPLPERADGKDWHPYPLRWWLDVQQSAMVSEFDISDRITLLGIAELWQVFWTLPPEAAMRKAEIFAQIRLMLKEFGFTPMGRRSLQITIEQAEAATEKGNQRRASLSGGKDDPRRLRELNGGKA